MASQYRGNRTTKVQTTSAMYDSTIAGGDTVFTETEPRRLPMIAIALRPPPSHDGGTG